MTLAASIADVRDACEKIIARHTYEPTLDACTDCGHEYACYARTTAEALVEALDRLELIDLSTMASTENNSVRGTTWR